VEDEDEYPQELQGSARRVYSQFLPRYLNAQRGKKRELHGPKMGYSNAGLNQQEQSTLLHKFHEVLPLSFSYSIKRKMESSQNFMGFPLNLICLKRNECGKTKTSVRRIW
tara:strand:+ start:74 stop:403 length:330 start_codon:yes stop_codon:yes gene_type:complete